MANDLTEQEIALLRREVGRRRKKAFIAWLLWFLAGFCGAHRFYLGRFRSGIAMLALALFIAIGFILSLALHIIGPELGVAIGLAILAVLIWLVVDIFRLPVMLYDDRQRVEEEVMMEIVAGRAG